MWRRGGREKDKKNKTVDEYNQNIISMHGEIFGHK